MHFPPLIHDLAVILGAAAVVSFIFHKLRLPVVLGYVIAGIAVGPGTPFLPTVTDMPNIQVWGDLGVIFLMFTLGLDFSFRRLAAVGMRATFTGALEISGMFVLGLTLGRMLGWDLWQSIFLGATITISSTTIILKSLENLNLMRSRFRDNVFGILIVEDLVAIILLVALTNVVTRGSIAGTDLLILLGQLLLVIGSWMIVGFFLVPRFLRMAASLASEELLTILSLGLCMLLVSVGAHFGYSLALGAFIMGSIIGETRESRKIEELVRPLRDLFVAVFFVSIGMRVDPSIFVAEWPAILSIALTVIVGKIIFVTLGSLLAGQRLRHALQSSFTMTQIGEFSFLIAGLGLRHGVTDQVFYSSVVAVSLLTTLTTPFFIKASKNAIQFSEKVLPGGVKDRLERYSLVLQSAHGFSSAESTQGKLVIRWLANGIIVTGVFIVGADRILPWMLSIFPENVIAQSAAWLLTCLITAPFIWGLATVFRSAGTGALFLSRLLALIWVGLLSSQFLSAWTSVFFTAAALVILVLLVYPQLESSYGWFENQFLASFHGDEKHQDKMTSLRRLAPWEAHLAQLKAHPDSEVVGHNLMEARLRERFGLNVVAIQRGSRMIVAPSRDERLFPDDTLLVLANDEQVESARTVIEGKTAVHSHHDLSDFDLKLMNIRPDSQFAEKSILSSRLRERYGVLVVGIEREGRRIMNPQSDLVLKAGDLVWIVGDRTKLREL